MKSGSATFRGGEPGSYFEARAKWGIVELMARLLYVLTGIATAIPVIWALGWSVWGAGVSITEYLSLLGSLVLVGLGIARASRRRVAGGVALLSTAGIWSFYLPGVIGVVRSTLTNQELSLAVLLWTPTPSPLRIEQSQRTRGARDMTLSAADIQLVQDTGISGKVSIYAANGKYGNGKHSRAILIMQEPVQVPVELKEPDATSVIYIQEGSRWRKFPENAPTLNRTIRITPLRDDPRQAFVMVELSTGATQGFGVWWAQSGAARPNR